jgi:pyruvate kinase
MAIETELTLLKHRRTRIVATLGPATGDAAVLRRLLLAGVDVVRLNMSHGTHDDHRRAYQLVREVSTAIGRQVAVLADLCGPKIRVGTFPGGSITLADGAELTVTTRQVPGSAGLICSQYEALSGDVVAGDRILLDDGAIELAVRGFSRDPAQHAPSVTVVTVT